MMRLRAWTRGLAALGAGAAWPLAFAPLDLYPVAILALAVLFLLWRDATPGRAFRDGLLFGLGLFAVGVSWVYVSMSRFGDMGVVLSGGITGLLVVVMALFPAGAGLVAVRLVRRAPPAAWVLVFPAAWTLFEWARGWFLTGFPWLVGGYSQIDAPLAGYAPLAGVYGVSLAAAASASLFLATLDRRDPARGRWLAMLVAIWAGGAALGLADWTRPAGEPLRVGLVQGNVPQDLKWHPGMRDVTVDLYTELTRAHWDSDLVIWPETAIPMFYDEARPYLDALAAEAEGHDADLVVGLIYRDPGSDRYYNSMINVRDRDAVYHKYHLVPFTEYLPFSAVLGRFIDAFLIPMSDFRAGDAYQTPMRVAGQAAALSICYEDAFGEEIIRALPEATLLVNVSNDAWFGDSLAPHQHLQIARMRALETGRWMARGTNTGVTAVIDARGRITARAPQFETSVLTAEIEPRTGATLYVRVGNWLAIGTAVLLLLVGLIAGRRRF